MSKVARLSVLVLTLLSAACFHAVVETGRTPSATVIRKRFRPYFLLGFVVPRPVNVAKECLSGVARVETYHTPFEMLISWATAGIFTPMSLRVTCAESGSSAAPDEWALDVG